MNKKLFLLLLVSSFGIQLTNVDTTLQSQNAIATESLFGFALNAYANGVKETNAPTENINAKKRFWLFEAIDAKLFPGEAAALIKAKNITLTNKEAVTIAGRQLQQNDSNHDGVIDIPFTKEMELVAGGSNAHASLLNYTIGKHIKTACGKATLVQAFINPTTDINTIKMRQGYIQALVDNPKLLKSIDAIVGRIAPIENKLLLLWNSISPVNNNLLKGQYFNLLGFKGFNNSSIALELTNRTYQSFMAVMSSVVAPVAFASAIKNVTRQDWTETFLTCKNATIDFFSNSAMPLKDRVKVGLSGAFIISYQALISYIVLQQLSSTISTCNHLQQILIDTATYVKAYSELKTLILANPELQSLNTPPLSKKLTTIVGNLKTNTFAGKPSFFSYTGRVLSTYHQLGQVKDDLVHTLATVGELDMYVAIAKLILEHKESRNSFCFAQFIEADRPEIHAVNFWNPFLNADVAIANNVTFDAETRNIILTGPNTCGKSTILKGLVLNVLFAQTFGIAPAQSFALTPFTKINCYLNIADDISTGTSLFKAEVIRAKKLLDSLSALDKNQFSLNMLDEIFTGTAAKEGEEAAFAYTQKLAAFDNSINIIATHYHQLTELEKTGMFKNFWTHAARNDDNSITRFFTMIPGISELNIAFDILKEEGIF